MSSSWFSVGKVFSGLWRKDEQEDDDIGSVTTDNTEHLDDDNNDEDEDEDTDDNDADDGIEDDDDDDEWQDRELTPTKYREVNNDVSCQVCFANETTTAMCEADSYGSLTSSPSLAAIEEHPELRTAAVLLASSHVIWKPQVTVYQVCAPVLNTTSTKTTIFTNNNNNNNNCITNNETITSSAAATQSDQIIITHDLCDSSSVDCASNLSYSTSTSKSSEVVDLFDCNNKDSWQSYPQIKTSLPPPLPAPDWPEAEENRLSSLRKRWGPEMRKVWGSVHQLANGPAAYKIKTQLKKMKKSTLAKSSSAATRWGLQGQSGFEDLRRYIKQGGDFCKELAAILQERSEAESQYSKTLAKLSSKLVKATKEGTGTVNSAWHRIAVEMDVQADVHRHFASALSEEVVKPLKQLLESQHRIRKSVENAVDKSGKNLSEWRAAEGKAKKNSFTCARENEKLREPNSENKNSRLSASSLHIHKQGTDKETKLETKRRKAEECVKKADVEYYSVCLRAERSRLEWESAIVRGSHCFQVLEEERLRGLKDLATSYVQNHNNIGPKFTQINTRLVEPLESCEIDKDLEIVSTLRTATEPSQEQMLPDFYPEHTALAMNRDRRKQALINLLQLIRADLERERRGKVGVENLARALKQTPTFASEDSQQNVHDKLHHMRSMLTYLEAARYKVQSALAELEGGPPVSHPLAGHIHVTRDRQGYQQSVLKVPPWVHNETLEISSEYSDWVDRGTADGTSVQPDSDFDEFSSQGSEKDYETSVIKVPEASPQRCKALYNYTANLYDELTLNPGDIINIHDKQPDGWWLGELNGVVGIFPATYVEEIK